MNNIKNFLAEIAYHDEASAEFTAKGLQFFVTVKNMSEPIAKRIVTKHFPSATIYSLYPKDTMFKIF